MWTINSLVQNKCKLQVMSSLLLIMSVGTLAFREVLSFCDVKFVGREKNMFFLGWDVLMCMFHPTHLYFDWTITVTASWISLGHHPSIHLVQVFASDLESGITTTMKATFWSRIWKTPKKQETTQFLENATRLPPSSILKTLSWDTSKNMGLAGFFPQVQLAKPGSEIEHKNGKLDTGRLGLWCKMRVLISQPGRQCHEKKQKKRQSKKRRQFSSGVSLFLCVFGTTCL